MRHSDHLVGVSSRVSASATRRITGDANKTTGIIVAHATDHD
jgi:hypothetical protein